MSPLNPSSTDSASTSSATPSPDGPRQTDTGSFAGTRDAGISGTKDASERPGLAAALLAVQRPPDADGIVVAKLDRLARALTVQEGILALVWRANAKLFTVDDGEVLADDPDDPMRTALRQIVGVIAQLDRAIVVKRMRDGRRIKATTGRKATGAYAYGYAGAGKGRDRDAAERADEQQAIARIVQLRAEGKNSYRWIAATLDAEGYKPRRAEHWSSMAVRNIVLRQLTPTA